MKTVTFSNVTITICAPSAAQAYVRLCNILMSAGNEMRGENPEYGLEYETDAFTEQDEDGSDPVEGTTTEFFGAL